MKIITRKMMIAEVDKRLSESRPTGNSFAARGLQMKWDRGTKLLARLYNGDSPTVYEVVGYFGKGARFFELIQDETEE